MGDLDTDSQMMRRQQAQDVSERIPADETHDKRGPTDVDPESRAAREAAKAGRGENGERAEDAVLRQNQAGSGDQSPADIRSTRRQSVVPGESLAGSGRSRLGA